MARTSTQRKRSSGEAEISVVADLNYSEAQSALELALAQLQEPDLPVEAMTTLYQQARAYAERCEQLLNTVEQTVALWDPQDPTAEPKPYTP